MAAARPWLVVVNPAAGSARGARRLRAFEGALREQGVDFELARTDGPGDAVAIVRDALAAGYLRFVAFGGDGTAHELANGLLGQQRVDPAETLLALAPVGTGNDWARGLGVPREPQAIAALLKAPVVHRVDAGLARFGAACKPHGAGAASVPSGASAGVPQPRFFVNVAGVGFDAHVVRLLGGRKGGAAAYLVGLLRGMASFRAPSLEVHAEADVRTLRLLAGLACIGRYFGGGMCVNPQARRDAGRLRCMLVESMSALSLLFELRRLFDGSIEASRFVHAFDSGRLRLQHDVLELAGAGVEADGEWIGETPVEFSIVPRALRVALSV